MKLELRPIALHQASRLYGALCRAAQALGYRRAVTYTLETEPGVTPRAAGFQLAGTTSADDWRNRSRQWSVNTTAPLFAEARKPTGAKVRWERAL